MPTIGVWSPERRRLTTGLVVVVTVVAFEGLAVATVLPVTLRELGHVALYGWAFSAFMLADIVGIAVSGSETDRRGPAPVLAVGLAVFAAGLVVGGTATSMIILVAGRAVQGLGAGAITSVAYASVGRGYTGDARARMLAVMSTAWVVPGLVGPAIAGAVAQHLSWRLVFVGLLPLVVAGAALSLPALSSLGPGEPSPQTPATAALALAAGTGLALAGLSARSPVTSPLLVAAGAVAAFAGIRRLMPEGTLRARAGLPSAVAIRGLLTFSFFGAEAFIPLDLTSLHHQSPTRAGLVLTAATLSWTAGSWLQAHRGSAWGRRRTMVTGLALVAGAIAGIGGVVAGESAWWALVSWAVAGLGMGLAYPTTILIALDAAPAGHEGSVSAAVSIADVLGVALGTGLGGAAVAYSSGLGHGRVPGIGAGDAVSLAAAALALVACRRLPGAAATFTPGGPPGWPARPRRGSWGLRRGPSPSES